MPPRKPIQIAAVTDSEGINIIALADDGTIWVGACGPAAALAGWEASKIRWSQIPELPQPRSQQPKRVA
jgi:hypothetical protein